MYLARIYAKLFSLEDTRHRWPGARQWRHFRITFLSSNQTYDMRVANNGIFSSRQLFAVLSKKKTLGLFIADFNFRGW